MKPTRKVTSMGLAGALATLIIHIAGQLGHEFTVEETGALVTLIGFIVAYFTKDKQPS